MMNERDLIMWVGKRGGQGVTVVYMGYYFTFDFASGWKAVNGDKSYSSFDDLAGMVEDMFKDGCFNG
jgi:hypothetical protein